VVTAIQDRQTAVAPKKSNGNRHIALAVLFFLSGFCSLLYQSIWLRLAFANFGVITPVMSVVVSVFMVGLGLGSWFSGKLGAPLRRLTGCSAIAFYGISELIIGIGALAVPVLFKIGQHALLTAGAADSAGYLALSAVAIGLSVLPWAIAMGATFPFAMSFLGEETETETETQPDKRTFGFLYLANVAGAVVGVLLPVLVMVESIGFSHSLLVGALINFALGTFSLIWATKLGRSKTTSALPKSIAPKQKSDDAPFGNNNAVLFTTGFISLAMEVVWTRSFTPVIGTVVYSFAWLLGTYMVSTFVGSFIYRRDVASKAIKGKETLVYLAAITSLVPILINDPRLGLPFPAVVALASIVPFCAILGYLTPLLIDDMSAGNEEIAGRAYAVNVIGCILGSPVAGYLLLPVLGAKGSLAALSIPLIALACKMLPKMQSIKPVALAALAIVILGGACVCDSWEEGTKYKKYGFWIKRDYAATTISYGADRWKMLLVNGMGMTGLCVDTVFMGYLPASFHMGPTQDALVICLGMGTTYRSLLHWGMDVTAVELIPGVKKMMAYFYSDKILWNNPHGRITIDDGRRFLMRTPKQFDIVVIDPPPPVDASCSSLLYSEQFYETVKQHLKPGGILQQWYPLEDERTLPAVVRSLKSAFPYIRAYNGLSRSGIHFLCSERPIPDLTADQMLSRLPSGARDVLTEWLPKEPNRGILGQISGILGSKVDLNKLLSPDESIRITDDHPYNEYHWMRDRSLAN
jgi:spermidine synthase